MAAGVDQGYLVIADITGFTPFLAESELDHSQAILSEIFKMIVSNFTPTLTIAEIEGDAVFGFAAARDVPRGETIFEMIEATYMAFRDKRESSRRLATCRCKACQMIPTLDLKFITHFGEYALQGISGRQKPLGSSVNLVHRLLKNTVSQATGWRAYALFTEESLNRMEVYPLNINAHVESYEHLGAIRTYSIDLDERYARLTDERRVCLDAGDADVIVRKSFPMPPSVLWEWLNNPEKRSRWMIDSAWQEGERPEGRTGRGATNHCSNSDVTEMIMDWRPFSYYTVELSRSGISALQTVVLDPIEGGVQVEMRMRLNGSLPRWLLCILCRMIVRWGTRSERCLNLLAKILNEEKSAAAA
jgi:hypothetical protein